MKNQLDGLPFFLRYGAPLARAFGYESGHVEHDITGGYVELSFLCHSSYAIQGFVSRRRQFYMSFSWPKLYRSKQERERTNKLN